MPRLYWRGRLYWKIFLGFWLAMVVIVTVTSWSIALLAGEPGGGPGDPRRDRRHAARFAAAAHAVVDAGGGQALARWMHRRRDLPRGARLVDAGGRELSGRPLRRYHRAALAGELAPGAPPVRVHELTAPDGSAYRLLLPVPRRPWTPPRPTRFAMGLGIAIAVSALLCWWLARYLTGPIRHLQQATRRLAAGDLSARVGDVVAPRRDEIADLAADFDRMAERLAALVAAQRRLLRDCSHELRSPLARLQVALELARRRGRGDEAELERIGVEAGRLERLIGELLSLMRLEAGAELPREPVDLAGLLESVARDAAFEAAERDRTVQIGDLAPATIDGDPGLLRSAVENVIRNAVRHTAARTAVEVALLAPAGGWIEVRVRDHGPGVPEADLPHLFDPFYRVEAARERERGGFGLGLAIAWRALHAHGGEIVAANAGGGGLELRLRLRLPARPAPA